MEFDHPVRGIPRHLMETVNILCDDAVKFSQLFEFGYRIMGTVGLDVRPGYGAEELPGASTHLDLSDKSLKGKLPGIKLRPDTTGGAKIRNSRLGTDPRPGKDHDPSSVKDTIGYLSGLPFEHFVLHRRNPPWSIVTAY